MRNKVGLCIEYTHHNYGSMLQSWATVMAIENLGCEYEIIRYSRKPTVGLLIRSLDRIPSEIKRRLGKTGGKKNKGIPNDIKNEIQYRNALFDRFSEEKFTNLSKICDTFLQLRELSREYATVLVGSDQLWRPQGYSTGFFNLLFVDDSVPKIAYATSFGVGCIPENKKKIAKRFLSRIDHISVRELRASEMIHELIGRKVPTVCDPTILFCGDDWRAIIPECNVVEANERYILCYFLGSNDQYRKEALELQKKTGSKIVFLPHLDEFIPGDEQFGDIRLYRVGPEQFVNLIRNAAYVCTDSFHGTVFSILNHKKFMTFNRFESNSLDSRNSRIDSLLKILDLSDRRYRPDCCVADLILQDIDFDAVEAKLTEFRAFSYQYLKDALSIIERDK